MKINAINNNIPIVNNASINFRSNRSFEYSDKSSIGVLIHETYFFREPKTDEFVQDYILKNFSSKNEINIVCAGCSSGEEAYSYSMMLDDIKDKISISAFDLSQKSIDSAKSATYIIRNFKEERFLKKRKNISDKYKAKCSEKFHQYFQPIKIKPAFLRYRETYSLKKNSITNCDFFQGDIKKLTEIYPSESVDVLLIKNTLYHIICGNNRVNERVNLPNSQEIISNIVIQMNKILKKGGIVVFGENETQQCNDIYLLEKIMSKYGFRLLSSNKEENNFHKNIWEKTNNI